MIIVISNIAQCLKDEGYMSCIVPYPGACGLRMKDFAEKTDFGQIGDNFYFYIKNAVLKSHTFDGIACSNYQMSQHNGVTNNYDWK